MRDERATAGCVIAPAVLFLLLAAAPALAVDQLSATGSPSPADTFDLDGSFVTGVTQITDFRWLPDDRLVVVAKGGAVFVRPALGGALVAAGSFAVDTSSEKGLLGVAVDPQFSTNRRLYFYYSAAGGTSADKNRVVVRTLGANDQLDPGETVILDALRGPANHDGGALEIGPDGLLYVGVGDTGCNSNAPPGNPPTNYYATCLADDPSNNGGGNGKILRIGLDGSIPPGNPLVGATNVTACGSTCGTAIDAGLLGSPRTEVYAWGFRNPWRIWIDPTTARLWVGDVGEISYEEITVVEPGRHHGWPWREADRGYPVDKCRDVRIGTAAGNTPIFDQDCVDPVYRCRHDSVMNDPTVDGGCVAVTGGQIVDSCQWPLPFRGRYVFADSSTSRIWTLEVNPARTGVAGPREDFATVDGSPVSVRTGNDGALYVASLTLASGRIIRIAPKSPIACGSTTSTTTPTAGSTTTTSVPVDACAGLAGFDLARCRIAAAIENPVCPEGEIDDGFASAVVAKLGRVADLVDRAADAPKPRKVRKLLGQADRRLASIPRAAKRAARKDKATTACRTAIGSLVTSLRDVLAPLVP